MSAEHVPTLFRGLTPEDASAAAKAWARAEGLRVRTIATIRRRDDLPVWTPEGPAWEVTLVLDVPDGGPIPEPPTLWGAA